MRRTVFAAVLFFLALAPGCGGGGSSEPVNSIKIESFTPASPTPGNNTITVSYDLQTADSAVIDHCYLEPFSNRWMGCQVPIGGSTGMSVNRGKRTLTITDTETVTGSKLLYVVLVPNGDYNSTVGVVSDVYPITVP